MQSVSSSEVLVDNWTMVYGHCVLRSMFRPVGPEQQSRSPSTPVLHSEGSCLSALWFHGKLVTIQAREGKQAHE